MTQEQVNQYFGLFKMFRKKIDTISDIAHPYDTGKFEPSHKLDDLSAITRCDDNGNIEFAYFDYDGDRQWITIPETYLFMADDELIAAVKSDKEDRNRERLERLAQKERQVKAEKEAAELAQYEALKAKFEKS
jgi:hypothetical protein